MIERGFSFLSGAALSLRSPLRRLPLVVPFGVNPQGTGVSVVVAVAAAAATFGVIHARASKLRSRLRVLKYERGTK
jgi:hypothetical protein